MYKKSPVILFFTAGMFPTEAEFKAAADVGASRFRNSKLVKDGDSLEKCDAVAGMIPEPYRKAGIPMLGEQQELKLEPVSKGEGKPEQPSEGENAPAPVEKPEAKGKAEGKPDKAVAAAPPNPFAKP